MEITYPITPEQVPSKVKRSQVLLPNGRVDVERLTLEVHGSDITVALAVVEVAGNDCTVKFKGDLSGGEIAILDGVVAQHSGEHLLSPRQQVVMQPFSASTRNIALSGHREECALGADTDLDISWAEEREIQGAEIAVKNFTDGDYVVAQLVHPAAGVLLEFGKSYVKPDGRISLEAESAKTIPAGLILRIIYTSVATTGPQPVLYADVKTWR